MLGQPTSDRFPVQTVPGFSAALAPELVRLDYDNADIFLRQTPGVDRDRSDSCAKEPWTVAWIHEFMKPGQAFCDVGANTGAYSLIAAKHTRQRASILAFEPAFASYASLCTNVSINDCEQCITPIPLGLSRTTGISVFRYRDLRAGAAVHRMGTARVSYEPVYSQPVLAFRLDDLIKQFNLPWPNHIKVDVDGTELDVIDGAKACLNGPAFRSLMIEIDVRQSGRVLRALKACGLVLSKETRKTNKSGDEMSVWYGVFTRP